MPIYTNRRPDAPIRTVEFAPMPQGNVAFVSLRSGQDVASAKQLLINAGQQVTAETSVNGQPILVSHGDRSQAELLKLLGTGQDDFALKVPPKKGIDPWVLRGTVGTAGQLLQVTSSAISTKGLDGATMGFALLNLIASGINVVFGSEKKDDVNRKRYIKNEVGKKLAPHLAQGAQLPDVESNRSALRKDTDKPQSGFEKFHNFMRHNSVLVGEIGLRSLGSAVLVFPITEARTINGRERTVFSLNKWKGGFGKLIKGDLSGAFNAAKNPDNGTLRGGLIFLAGKSLGMMSKDHDPYDTKPRTPIDYFRENIAFKLGSLVEAGAGMSIAVDRMTNPKRTINIPNWKFLPEKIMGKQFRGHNKVQDYLGGVGGMLFAGAYLIRFFAQFGERQLDVKEVKAYATDALAQMPPEKMPQLMADCAATIKEHAGKKPIEFGEIYAQMATDMFRYHHMGQQPVAIAPTAPQKQNDQEIPRTTVQPQARQRELMLQADKALAAHIA